MLLGNKQIAQLSINRGRLNAYCLRRISIIGFSSYKNPKTDSTLTTAVPRVVLRLYVHAISSTRMSKMDHVVPRLQLGERRALGDAPAISHDTSTKIMTVSTWNAIAQI